MIFVYEKLSVQRWLLVFGIGDWELGIGNYSNRIAQGEIEISIPSANFSSLIMKTMNVPIN